MLLGSLGNNTIGLPRHTEGIPTACRRAIRSRTWRIAKQWSHISELRRPIGYQEPARHYSCNDIFNTIQTWSYRLSKDIIVALKAKLI